MIFLIFLINANYVIKYSKKNNVKGTSFVNCFVNCFVNSNVRTSEIVLFTRLSGYSKTWDYSHSGHNYFAS